jgi:radical SAM-linked protein
MRFASHRDVARAFERGVRKAGLPIAYSAGFTPHPKISYPGGAPTGVASEAEYLSLALTERQAETQVCQRLNAALPNGIDVIDVTEDAGGAGKPSGSASSGRSSSSGFAHLEASEWRMVLPGVERLTDKGVRRLDARTAVLEMTVLETAELGFEGCAILRMVVLHTAPAVRPEDIVTALREQDGIVTSSPPMITRLAQGQRAQLTGQALLAGEGVS